MEKKMMIDPIERQDAIDEVSRFIGYIDEDMIKRLPSVERKRGKRNNKFDGDVFNCLNCGHTFMVIQGGDFMNFCPNCGSDMKGE